MKHSPDETDWNTFWELSASKRFGKVSWSKRRIMRVLRPHLASARKALDAGCGSGFFAAHFCDNDLETAAVDYAPEALNMARTATGGRAQVAKADLIGDDLAQAVGADFDIVFSDGLFEHFSPSQQDKIMANFIKVLADDGVIVTFVPNRWSPWEWIRPFYMPGIEEKPFDLKGLVDLNERNGLRVLARGGVNTLPFRLSPEGGVARVFGMLLYTVASKEKEQ